MQANFVTISRIITVEWLPCYVSNASLAEWLRSRLQSGVSRFDSGDWLSFGELKGVNMRTSYRVFFEIRLSSGCSARFSYSEMNKQSDIMMLCESGFVNGRQEV